MNSKIYLLSALCSLFIFYANAQVSYVIPDGNSESTGFLHFVENKGQVQDVQGNAVPDIKYYNTQSQTKMWLQDNGKLSWTQLGEALEDTLPDTLFRIDMQPIDNEGFYVTQGTLLGEESTGAVSNYYQAHTGTSGIENCAMYRRMTWAEIYPDIHQQVYSNNSGVKFYYIVEPGADPNDIHLRFTGQSQMNVSTSQMNLYMAGMQVVIDNAVAYEINGSGQVVPLSWTPGFQDNGNGEVSFITGTYNTNNRLVIQVGSPVYTNAQTNYPGNLEYSSYLTADQQDEAVDIETAANGHVYIAGVTSSSLFALGAGVNPVNGLNANLDAILFHFNGDMKAEHYTYYGSAESDQVAALSLQKIGDKVLIAGNAESTLPKSTGAKPGQGVNQSGYVAEFTSNLSLNTSVWYGGDAFTEIVDMEVNHLDQVFLLGHARFQTTPIPLVDAGNGAYYQSTSHSGSNSTADAFIARMNSNLSLEHSTWFGSDGIEEAKALDLDNAGNLFVLLVTDGKGSPNPFWGCGVTVNGKLPNCPSSGFNSLPLGSSGSDYYVAEFNSNLEVQWGTHVGSPTAESASSHFKSDLKVDDFNPNNLYVAMYTENPSQFTQSTATSGYIATAPPGTYAEFMLLKFQSRTLSWHTAVGSRRGRVQDVRLETDNSGTLFLSAKTNAVYPQVQADWCTEPLNNYNFPLCDNGGGMFMQDVFTAPSAINAKFEGFFMAFDSNDDIRWSTWFGGDGVESPNALHFNSTQQRVYMVGGSKSNVQPIPLRQHSVPGSHYQDKLLGASGAMVGWFGPDLTIGQEEFDSKDQHQIAVYPNPTRNELLIPVDGEYKLQILDMLGKVVMEGKIDQENNLVNVQQLGAGAYVLNLESKLDTKTVRFIKE